MHNVLLFHFWHHIKVCVAKSKQNLHQRFVVVYWNNYLFLYGCNFRVEMEYILLAITIFLPLHSKLIEIKDSLCCGFTGCPHSWPILFICFQHSNMNSMSIVYLCVVLHLPDSCCPHMKLVCMFARGMIPVLCFLFLILCSFPGECWVQVLSFVGRESASKAVAGWIKMEVASFRGAKLYQVG